jgi:hypothetical protein
MSQPPYTPGAGSPYSIGSSFSFVTGRPIDSTYLGGSEPGNDDVRQQNGETEASRSGNTSRQSQRGKNWNEEDSKRLVQAYAWVESVKKRTTISK